LKTSESELVKYEQNKYHLVINDLMRSHLLPYLRKGGDQLDPKKDEVIVRSCPLCYSDNSRYVAALFFSQLVVCRNCGMEYFRTCLSVSLREEILAKFEIDRMPELPGKFSPLQQKFGRVLGSDLGKLFAIGDEYSKRYVPYFQRLSPLLIRKKAFLDLGAGFGHFCKSAQEFGFQKAVGLEQDPIACELCKKHLGLELVCQNVHEFSRAKYEYDFDLVRMGQSLEHFDDPQKVLVAVRQMLHSDGLLWLDVPNTSSLSRLIYGLNLKHIQLTHVTHFTASNLRSILETAGFRVIALRSYNYNLATWLLGLPAMRQHTYARHHLSAWISISRARTVLDRIAKCIPGGWVAIANHLSNRLGQRFWPYRGEFLFAVAVRSDSILEKDPSLLKYRSMADNYTF
jgi:2-polyprenyl-3-methyl-5-hydroxy-6-metoxy-1,4-benzoquinol methylase